MINKNKLKLKKIMEMNKTLEIVIVQAMAKEPLAWLYEVQFVMSNSHEESFSPENGLDSMKVVFGMPNNRTLMYDIDKDENIVESVIEQPYLEDRPIPHKIKIDINEAFDRLKQANILYDLICPNVVLRHPLYVGTIEPAYIFCVKLEGKQEFISVGLYSGDVKFIK